MNDKGVVGGGEGNQPDALPGQRLAATLPPIYAAFDPARWLIPLVANKSKVPGAGQGKPRDFCGLPKKYSVAVLLTNLDCGRRHLIPITQDLQQGGSNFADFFIG